ncbi:MAG: DUF481 domain-containing protein [Phycisphaerales bacterium]|jgi:hypothetical protein|nr:DUF481 domain-containing protein [Phycisphaerales bacterium]
MMLAWIGVLGAVTGAAGPTGQLITLHRGDQILAEVVDVDQGAMVLKHPIFGEMRVPFSDIASVRPFSGTSDPDKSIAPDPSPSDNAGDAEGGDARGGRTVPLPIPVIDGAGRSGEAGMPPEPAAPPPPPSPPAVPWTGSVGAAVTASDNTTSTYNLRLSGSLKRAASTSTTDLSVSYYLNSAGGVVTDNDLLARGQQNWFSEDTRWEVFVQSTYQYDQFESWAHRLSPYGGLGYRLFEEEEFELTLKGGGGMTWEQNVGLVRPQALFEVTTSWTINDRQSLEGYSSIAPDVNDPSNFLATMTFDWKIRLGEDSPLALSIGVRDIYDSTPTPGATHNDFKAWAGVVLSF